MKTQELATWFGVSFGHFRNTSTDFYDKLFDFCDYEKVYGGIIIKEIYFNTYDKSLSIINEINAVEEIRRCIVEQCGLSTISGMARVFTARKFYPSERTAERRLTKILTRLFGITKDKGSVGELGSREYIWAIKLDDLNHYRFITDEENMIFDSIISRYYAERPEQIKQDELYKDAVFGNEMTPEEYFLHIQEEPSMTFYDCLMQFLAKTGHMIARATKYDVYLTRLDQYLEKLRMIQKAKH